MKMIDQSLFSVRISESYSCFSKLFCVYHATINGEEKLKIHHVFEEIILCICFKEEPTSTFNKNIKESMAI
jgi:hypothetical protein